MKRLISLLALLLITFFSIKGLKAQKFAIGPRVGFVASDFRGANIDREKFRKGLQAGLFFSFHPTEWFAIRPEALFDQKGSESIIFGSVTRTVKVNYLTVPVALDFRIPVNGKIYPKVMIGPYTSIMLNQKETYSADNISVSFEDTDIKRIDVGGFVGAGFDLEGDVLLFSADIRYMFGALDVSENNQVELRNTQVAITTGLGFKF